MLITEPTNAQVKALQFALNDGLLAIGGLDGRPVRLSVALRCRDKGWLVVRSTPIPQEPWWDFELTEAGRAVLR